MRYKTNYILIIGAKSDIGKAIAKKYAENGYNLYLAARNSKKLNNFANDIKIRNNNSTKCIDLDILDYSSHNLIYHSLEIKPIGVIVVAGYLGDQKKAQINFDESKKIIDSNFTGIVSILNIISYDFKNSKNRFIIGISSVAGERGRKNNYIYGSAKSALSTYLSGLRNQLYESKVHIMTVKPGFVKTNMTKHMKLPRRLTSEPFEVAETIYNAQQKGKDVVYVKSIWKFIMFFIRSIPEWKFKRMNI